MLYRERELDRDADPLDAFAVATQGQAMTPHPLQKWRMDNKISISAAAREAGINRATWTKWENGTRLPRLRTLPRVLKMTGLRAEEFMGGA